ncbi:hypothetical protein SAMN05216334_12110 [Nitrosomonas ureae]|uniref:Uncharacterized protein n=1 Tax=Nitrosomonas ureae TaxID=44577 RepID=A0A1H5WTQ7_9PROT|nr:hypothetical protein SAMN05216334_12110 [Nitrosomonas ureae]
MNKVEDERLEKTTRHTISELLQDYDNSYVLFPDLIFSRFWFMDTDCMDAGY